MLYIITLLKERNIKTLNMTALLANTTKPKFPNSEY